MPDAMPPQPDSFRPGPAPGGLPKSAQEQITRTPAPKKPPLAKETEGANSKPAPSPPKDGFREIVETIVFVVVLVVLLKTFLAEAFVIPTGSMATTLLGYHKEFECSECHYVFPVNCSQEAEPQNGQKVEVTGGVCPNCLKLNQLPFIFRP